VMCGRVSGKGTGLSGRLMTVEEAGPTGWVAKFARVAGSTTISCHLHYSGSQPVQKQSWGSEPEPAVVSAVVEGRLLR
jgi:hypothetical protein